MRACVEEDLLIRLTAGDPDALEQLYTLTRDRLFTVVCRLGTDPMSADDLVHEVYLRIWEKRHQLPKVDSVMAYLCATARNLWRNQRKHRNFLRRFLDQFGRRQQRPRSAQPSLDQRADIAQALLTLDEDPREVFTLHRFAGLSYREIAEIQGISVKTVEARMKHAFDELRAGLRIYLDEKGKLHDL